MLIVSKTNNPVSNLIWTIPCKSNLWDLFRDCYIATCICLKLSEAFLKQEI